jgi:riboflavin synthase
MFTGIVEEIGIVKKVDKSERITRLTISGEKIIKDIKKGDSVCVNGVCLTVVSTNSSQFTVEVIQETLKKTNLNEISPGAKVNLERALKFNDRLNGHFVLGHVDGIGRIESIIKLKEDVKMEIVPEKWMMKYIVYKGSIAVDGVSLTVAKKDVNKFTVALIPYTLSHTILGEKKRNDKVNIELDILAKYIENLTYKEKKIDYNFLKERGFV